jgi:hypothetical protein
MIWRWTGSSGRTRSARPMSAAESAPAHIADAYGIARRSYYYRLADRRPASRKYARRRDGGKGGWIARAESLHHTALPPQRSAASRKDSGMGVIGRAITSGAIASVGEAAEDLSEVFVANATREMELSQEAYAMALEAATEEYRHAGSGWFDRFVNGLNRLPRPLMALGTIGLFVFAMVDPVRPSRRAWWGSRRCPSRSGGCWARSSDSISVRGSCIIAACRAWGRTGLRAAGWDLLGRAMGRRIRMPRTPRSSIGREPSHPAHLRHERPDCAG